MVSPGWEGDAGPVVTRTAAGVAAAAPVLKGASEAEAVEATAAAGVRAATRAGQVVRWRLA